MYTCYVLNDCRSRQTTAGLYCRRAAFALHAFQSCLSTLIGSMRAARRAGIDAARRQAATMQSRLAAYATGSNTWTILPICERPGCRDRSWRAYCAAEEDRGADQEQRRCSDLDADEQVSSAARARVPCHSATHGTHQLEARRLERRHEPEGGGRADRASEQEQHDAPVRGGRGDPNVLRKFGRHRCRQRVERCLEKHSRDDEPARRGRQRELQTLREQLPDDAPA